MNLANLLMNTFDAMTGSVCGQGLHADFNSSRLSNNAVKHIFSQIQFGVCSILVRTIRLPHCCNALIFKLSIKLYDDDDRKRCDVNSMSANIV